MQCAGLLVEKDLMAKVLNLAQGMEAAEKNTKSMHSKDTPGGVFKVSIQENHSHRKNILHAIAAVQQII